MSIARLTRKRDGLLIPRVILAIFAAMLGLTCLLTVHSRGTTVDDAFIVFRYADNLGAGLGFRWNPTGTPSEGFSSTTALVAVAALMRAGLDPVIAALVLNLLGAAATIGALLVAIGFRTWTAPIACLPILYVLADGNFVVHASRGLETAFFVAVVVWFLLLAGHVVGAGAPRTKGFLLLALASLVLALSRPDAPLIVSAAWLVAAIMVWRRGEPLREAVPGLAMLIVGVGAYITWRVWYFGAPLPTPYYVKANLPTWSGVREAIAFAVAYRALLIPAVMVSALCWVRLLRPRSETPLPPLATLAVLVIVPVWLIYSARILHETGYNHRLSYPAVAVAALGLGAGLRFLLTTMVPRPGRAMRIAAIASLVVGLAVASRPLVAATLRLRQPEPTDAYVSTFTAVGRAIGSLGLEDRITFVTPIAGAMPYFSRARHIDPFGLSSDELSRRRPRSERQQFLNDLRWDVTTAVTPPASPGARDAASDPVFRTPYFTEFVIPAEKRVALLDVLPNPEVGWLEYHHSDMRKLRDTATFVGMLASPAPLDPPRFWRHYLYVSRASPHHDALVGVLRGVVVPAPQDSDTPGGR